jgi:hypothetical protein
MHLDPRGAEQCIWVDHNSVVCPSLEPGVDYPTTNICWLTSPGSIATARGILLASMQDELLAHLTTQPTPSVHIRVRVRPFMDRRQQAPSKNWHGTAGDANLPAVTRFLLVAAPGYSTTHNYGFSLPLNPITFASIKLKAALLLLQPRIKCSPRGVL